MSVHKTFDTFLIHKNSPELLLLNFLLSTYTITAISWLPPLISQLFSHWPF